MNYAVFFKDAKNNKKALLTSFIQNSKYSQLFCCYNDTCVCVADYDSTEADDNIITKHNNHLIADMEKTDQSVTTQEDVKLGWLLVSGAEAKSLY